MAKKIGVNEPCLCGSGKKYKKCCLHLKSTEDKNVSTSFPETLESWLKAQNHHFPFWEALEQYKEWQQIATALLKYPETRIQQTGHAMLAVSLHHREQYDEALHHFAKLPTELPDSIFLNSPDFARYFWICKAESLCHVQRQEEVLACYLKAHTAQATVETYVGILLQACALNDHETVAQYLPEAESLDPNNFFFQLARIFLLQHQQKWDECRRWFEQHTQEEFEQYGMFSCWLKLSMQILAHTESVFAALRFSERYLSLILAEKEIWVYREKLWEELSKTYEQIVRATAMTTGSVAYRL